MAPKTSKRPSPEDLLVEVKGKEHAKTYQFEDYLEVVHELVRKDYSYAKIAEFLAERLGIKVTRGQVYRAYKMWLEQKEYDERQAVEEYFVEPVPDEAQDEFEAKNAEAAIDVLNYLTEHHSEEGSPLRHIEILGKALARLESEEDDERKAREADQQIEKSKLAKSDDRKS